MIRDEALLGNRSPRRQLPAGLLSLLVTAARGESTLVSIAVCDQLAPTLLSNEVVLTHCSIPDTLEALCFLAPPAAGVAAVTTMAPDLADHATCPPHAIMNQWRKAVDESWPSWRNARFEAIDRNEFYQRLPKVDAVVRTLSDEPYANVILHLDPSRGEVLLRIPREISAQLAETMSLAGHSNAIAVVPASLCSTFQRFHPRAIVTHSPFSAPRVAAALSTLWLPDTHEQRRDRELSSGLGLFLSGHSDIAGATRSLSAPWRAESVARALSFEGFQSELDDRRLVAVIITTTEISEDCCYLMKNWISGCDGGY